MGKVTQVMVLIWATISVSLGLVWAIKWYMKRKYKLPDFNFNEYKYLVKIPHFCCRHKFTLDSVQMSPNPDEDLMMFSCKTKLELINGETPRCSATRTIERQVFWRGAKKIQEMYIDPEWLENYENNLYNQNMREFEKHLAMGHIYVPPPVNEFVFPDYKD